MYKIKEVFKLKIFDKANSRKTGTVMAFLMMFFVWLDQHINNSINFPKANSFSFAFAILSLLLIALIIALLFKLILKIGKVNVKLSQITDFAFFLMVIKSFFNVLETLVAGYWMKNEYIGICIEIAFILLCCILIYFFFSNNLNTNKILPFAAMATFVGFIILYTFASTYLINAIGPSKNTPSNDYSYLYKESSDYEGYDDYYNESGIPVDYDSIVENMK